MRINLRELFLLILIVALSLGWWIDRSTLKVDLGQASLHHVKDNLLPSEIAEIFSQMKDRLPSPQQPVLAIHRFGVDEVRVLTGTPDSHLKRSGNVFELKRVGGRWQLQDCTNWASATVRSSD
ncbi:hypothetical protein NA78x_004551 [Anatilimnocola sp. NA78]|uniref:hypothetical protein n=1 Tax=Anatilimnocola sp. NA78 TaxID=3415683 RepID=UPI003CE4FDEF